MHIHTRNSGYVANKITTLVLAVHVSSVLLPEEPLGGPASFLREVLLLPGVGGRVFVLGV